jgi:TolB-like protein
VSFISEANRRNVIKVALAYGAVSWLLIQIVTSIEAPLNLPDWFDTAIIVLALIGFPVALMFAWAFELTPEGIKPTESVAKEASITRETGHKLNRITIAVLAVAVALLLVDRFVTGDQRTGVIPNSIAVLPFDNLSPDRGDAYFAPGLHEEILNQLEKIQDLTVIARTTMRQYANTDKTIGEIATELNVETVMEGSVRYANDAVRVTAQLIDPVTDGHLWSDTFQRPFEDVFAIESEIAMNVANAMAIEFSAAEQESLDEVVTTSPEAYALLLSASSGVGTGSPAATLLALEQIDRAVELDPRSAAIQSRKASAFTYATAFFPERRDELLSEAMDAANSALAIDPDIGDAYVSLAMVATARGQWSTAEANFERADTITRNARREPYAAFNFVVGNTQKAFENISIIRDRDPLNSNAWFWSIVAEDTLGNVEGSLEAYERGRELFAVWPTGHVHAVVTLLGAGEIERAIGIAQQYSPNEIVELVATNLESPATVIAELNRIYLEDQSADRSSIANFAAFFGDTELAIGALRDYLQGFPIGGHLLWRPVFRDVRRQPAFKDLLRDFGFVDYWRQFGWADACRPLGGDDFECA